MLENDGVTEEKINYFSGVLTLYIKGNKRAYDIFSSKKEMRQIMEEWQLEYAYVDGVEIGVIFD